MSYFNMYEEEEQLKGDEIVITGVTGLFPDSENTQKFKENLFSKTDMVNFFKNYEKIKHPEVPKKIGKIEGLDKFDATFFRMTHQQADSFDPIGRKILEQSFSAIFDAGINPETLKNSKLGVFLSSAQSDATYLTMMNLCNNNKFTISGCSKTMLANRVSYWIDGKGPSFGLDNGCAGSMSALDMACNRLKSGEINCAIVGGCSFSVLPVLSYNMKRAGLLCVDGKTKCFDKNGDGCAKSDAICVYFLQKAKDAKRIYLKVLHVKGKYIAAPDGSLSLQRNPKELEKFFEEFYSEIDVSPHDVEYVEANAFGIAEADGNELEAIGNFFGKEKTIKIGSVKSNIGNTDNVSGACSVIKMCFAYKDGLIPANLHYNEPQNHIAAVREGRLQVVTENEPFNRGYTAINNFCYTGANFHALLKGYYKRKDTELYKSTIPRLVLVSGRQEEGVNKILDFLEANPLDAELCALLNNIFKYNIPGHTGRGYAVLDTNKDKTTMQLARSFEIYSGKTPPIWFLYSGMGSQWAGMGEELLKLPVFAAAIERCHKVLQPKGLNIIKIITDTDKTNLNVLTTLVAITAIQIGLTDVLKSLGIFPSRIIGHSIGELGCAYADEALTTEQTILAAYCRALVSYETEFIKGKMAAVGLGHNKVISTCPPEIEVACHNSFESSTISGPADLVNQYVVDLTAQGIFAKEVNSYDIAFHSKYIAEAGPKMLKLLEEFIVEPKLRSEKWLSTCYLPKDWEQSRSKYASGEYFTHNLMGCVFFEEAARFIPKGALILEIAPHGLLQAIMKRSHSKCINLSLTRRDNKDCVKLLLENIGSLYQNGFNPDVDGLYPKVKFPVSSETPLMSHLIGWEHNNRWSNDKLFTYELEDTKNKSTYKEFNFTINDDDYTFLQDYIRNGINVLPEAAVLVFLWNTLAECKGDKNENSKLVFKNVKFYSEIIIKPKQLIKILIRINIASSRFEVTKENSLIADGSIIFIKNMYLKKTCITFTENEINALNQDDINSLLSMRGYSYGEHFKNIISINLERNKAVIKWSDKWITFLDSLIQFNAISRNMDGISNVRLINKLTINISEHNKFRLKTANGVQYYEALVSKYTGYTMCHGVIFKDIVYNDIPKTEIVQPVLHTKKCIEHIPSYSVDIHTILLTNLQIIGENVTGNVIQIKEMISNPKSIISNKIKDLALKIPLQDVKIQTEEVRCENMITETDLCADVLILHNILDNVHTLEAIVNIINENTYILVLETRIIKESQLALKFMKVITLMHTANQTIVLMKKTKIIHTNNIIVIPTILDNAMTIHTIQNMQKDKDIMLIVAKTQHFIEQDIIKALKTYENVYLYIINAKSPKFSITNAYYRDQIQKGLRVNIMLNNGQWGSFLYIPMSVQSFDKAENIKLISKEPDNVKSLTWIEAPITANHKNIQVHYSGLSMKDYKKLCEYEGFKCFGMDFSGIDNSGTRVMGLLPEGAIASTVEADNDLLWPVPQHWSLQEAATVPLPYVHAFYCLTIRCPLYPNNNVFINGAAGALGQAVIAVAHSLNCTVYGTVSNAEKKKFLLKLFPDLDEHNIGYTSDATFHDMVFARTNGKRCSIVINCGSGKTRKSAMGCVGFANFFLDVNNSDQKENKVFDMYYLETDRSYKSVNMSNIFNEDYVENKKALQVMLSEGIAKGFVRPITSVVYAPMNITRAFQLLASRNNRGRVLINMKDAVTQEENFGTIPRLTLAASNSYIVVCDGTVLSVELIDRLVQRGARRLLIHIDPKFINGYFQVKYSLWTQFGVRVELNSISLHTETSSQALLRNANEIGPIDGIFITYNELSKKGNAKILLSTENMDIALIVSNLNKATSRCNKLRYFAIITATSRYAFKENMLEYLEKICLIRNEQSLPSLFLRHIVNDEILQAKTLSILFNAMESSLKHKYVSVISSDLDDNVNNKIVKSETNFKTGFEAFIYILQDEISALELMVKMKTESRVSLQHELFIDPKVTHCLMIPGLEGNYKVFTSLSERLKIPAFALQLDDVYNSIPEIAKHILNNVKMRIHLKSPFYLIGYSFGVNVALEMAALLEKEGLVGVVICLDSSPEAMRVHLDTYLGNLTDEQLQNSIILHIYKHLTGLESTELKEMLDYQTNWNDKIQIFINNVKNYVGYSHQFLITLIQGVYIKIKMAKQYKPDYKLDSELILIKGVIHPNVKQLDDDYNLSKYTNKPVKVYAVEADHAAVPMNSEVPNFINRSFVR